jgi:hypothetical protein
MQTFNHYFVYVIARNASIFRQSKDVIIALAAGLPPQIQFRGMAVWYEKSFCQYFPLRHKCKQNQNLYLILSVLIKFLRELYFMKCLIVVCCLLLSLSVSGQKTLKGIVSDADGGQPIPGASVFLSNTSVGTVANAQGEFTLQIPAGKYDLIISSIGFETGNQTISSTDIPDFITIKLKTKAKELETVVFEPFEKDGWNKWGRFFVENFIGTSALAKDCILKNKDALKFRHSKKKNVLTAIGFEPLIIENKALGYTIRYQLEDFSFDFKTNFLYYAGYPLFQEMDGGLVKKRRWEDARSKAYLGSMMHFMRSVFRNTIAQESFDVFALKKVFNAEKARVKSVYRSRIKIHTEKATNLAAAAKTARITTIRF